MTPPLGWSTCPVKNVRDDGALHGRVRDELLVPLVGDDGGRVDDRGSLVEVGQRLDGEVEEGEGVRAERPLHVLPRDILRLVHALLLGGVVHEDVELPERVERPVQDLPTEVGIPDVTGEREAATVGLPDPLGRVLGVLVLVEVGDGDVGALAGKGDGDRTADPTIPAGDERDLPL